MFWIPIIPRSGCIFQLPQKGFLGFQEDATARVSYTFFTKLDAGGKTGIDCDYFRPGSITRVRDEFEIQRIQRPL